MKTPPKNFGKGRRDFLKNTGMLMAASSLGSNFLLSACTNGTAAETSQPDTGEKQDNGKKLGIALVGLGNYATGQLAPALQKTNHCYLAGIVTGTPEKEDRWMKQYDIPRKNVYNYDNYDEIADNEDIDIIYVVLPNSMHAEYTIRAAQAGKHVISEKPMATTAVDAQRMIDACKENNVKLSIGYRLHFEPHHVNLMQLGQKQVYGKVQSIDSGFGFPHTRDTWRVDKSMSGGGPLMDVGIYTVQGACYTMGTAPVEIVKAEYGPVTKPDLFDEVEQSIRFTMRFPNGAESTHVTTYDENHNFYKARAEEGWWELSPAFSYGGIKGETSEGPMNLPNVNQQARQMDDFAKCIKNNRQTLVPGEMGWRDMVIMEAIYEAADTGKSVSLQKLQDLKLPRYEMHKEVNDRLKVS